MASITGTITFLFLVLLLYKILIAIQSRLYHYFALRKHGCLPPPSLPQNDPIFGIDLILHFFHTIRTHRRMRSTQANHLLYGHTFQSRPFGRRVVSTISARNIQAVFAIDMDSFGIRATRHMSTAPLLGHGIISSDGARWKRSRGLVQPTIARRNLESLENFEVHLGRMLERIPRDGETVDLKGLFAQLILDSSSEFIFGESVDSLLSNSPENTKFLECFNYAKSGVGTRFFLGKMRFLYRDKKFWESCKYVNEWTQKRVDRAVEQVQKAGKQHDPHEIKNKRPKRDGQAELAKEWEEDLKTGSGQKLGNDEKGERYVLAYELAKQTDDRDAMRQELLNVFFAAHDSAAIALTSIMFDLARHPAAWEKLRKEVLALGDAPLTFESLKSLTYLRWVINESLRLHPVVAHNSRTCLRYTMLPTGGGPSGASPLLLFPGDTVSMSIYSLHRRSDLYGDDAEAFRPERWETLRPTWEFVPFSGGPRHCPAQQLARTEISYTLVRLARLFRRVENRDPVEEFVEEVRLTFESFNGAKVGLIPA